MPFKLIDKIIMEIELTELETYYSIKENMAAFIIVGVVQNIIQPHTIIIRPVSK